MKKLILIIAIATIVINNLQPKSFTLTDYFSGEYYCYSTSDAAGLNLGFCTANSCKTGSPIGESVKIENLEISAALKTLNANVIRTEYLPDGTIVIYAYSKLIPSTVELNNKNINVQLAHKGNYTTIGWPLILGSF